MRESQFCRKFACIQMAVCFDKLYNLIFQLFEPIFEQDQNFGVCYRHELFGLSNFINQILTHLRWVDTFAHALSESQMHHAREFITTGIPNKVHYEPGAILLIENG
jgi:hypothetical protein